MAMRLAPVGERAENLPESGVRVFEDLVRDHAREIQLFLRKLCGNHHDAEELAQDVFIKAYRKLDTLREPAATRRWLYTIAVNHFNDWIKPRRRAAMRAIGDIDDFDLSNPKSVQPAKQAAAVEFSAWLDESILALPDRQRTVLLLFSAKGFDYADIADALGISPDAVKMSLFHAREKLKKRVARFLG